MLCKNHFLSLDDLFFIEECFKNQIERVPCKWYLVIKHSELIYCDKSALYIEKDNFKAVSNMIMGFLLCYV